MNTLQLVHVPKDELITEIEKVVIKVLEALKISGQPEDEKELYTRKEVMELLGVTYSTLFNWNKKKILVPRKIGHRVYYDRKEVLACK
ncbi:helix-turn-helix domain-containing protein [Chryseobacterium sp. SG20098]|uniref:helix-turn-helix transcriptional regulator n=1 Tax=Chryseobacterium sp. SG20098 TaxID=3074145 RepID=UPI002882E76B|nr:helix-turn-helix domain-containing protein [Chryseobacterium sp. SG20098]WNI39009.1 helix-turn-helix domain-containing protein [Chryseobacterium sp. SG20098]